MAQAARVPAFQLQEHASPADPQFGDDDGGTWEGLEQWCDESEAWRARISKRAERNPDYDPWDHLNSWQADRQVLVWALKTTPARTLRGLRLKARVVEYADRGPLGNAGWPPQGKELAATIVQDLLAVVPPAPTADDQKPSRPTLTVVR